MPIQKVLYPQRDFSAGQVNSDARFRDDLDLLSSSARACLNMRPKATGQVVTRPGRVAFYEAAGRRQDYVRMSATKQFWLDFSAGALRIRSATDGSIVNSNITATYLWTDDPDSLAQISWAQAINDIVICFPGMKPQIARYAPASDTWSFVAFSFATANFASQQPFRRVSVPGATMTPSALTGSITLTCSQNYFDSSMIGSLLSIAGQQVEITAVASATSATATVANQLPAWVRFSGGTVNTAAFSPGMIAETETSQDRIEVGTVSAATHIEGTLLNNIEIPSATFATQALIGPMGYTDVTTRASTATAQPTVQWLEQFMGDVQGWPQACAFAQNRLIFYDFPQQPDAVLYSAIGLYDTFWIDSVASQFIEAAGSAPDSAILEYVPRNARVKHVVPFGDHIVFTDRGIFSIPISTSNPLKPGSVEFRDVSRDAVAEIRPVAEKDWILYVNEGKSRISAVVATGADTRSYTTQDVSDAHSDLITGPRSLDVATGDAEYPERFIYVVNEDGTVVVGRYVAIGDRQGVGWFPWEDVTPDKPVDYVTVAGNDVYYTVLYGSTHLVERETTGQWLDGAVLINNVPSVLVRSGKGPIWWMAGETVTLVDGRKDLGDRTVDVDGNIVELEDDDLSSVTIYAGRKFTQKLIPFVPNIQAGESRKQRTLRRKISRAIVKTANSTGFQWSKRTIPPYYWDDDTTADPPLRAHVEKVSVLGREYDPQITLLKERPGPLEVLEIEFEVTI